jgi:amidase
MTDIVFCTASDLAQAIASGALTAREVLEAYLARIDQCNPQLNALITLDAERARARAAAADAAQTRGACWGPLHGVPFTLKDCFETAGVRSTCGYPPLAHHLPAQDCLVAARLRAAGAILLGKSNVPPLANGTQTVNPLFGRTYNPWDRTRTPGGSSGGSAAAVAAGLTPFDVGSDLGGSIRIPAHFCGVYGLKLTGGALAPHGVLTGARPHTIPPEWHVGEDFLCFGPLARGVADLHLVAQALLAPTATPLPPLAPRAIESCRIAWSATLAPYPIGHEVQGAIRQFIARVATAGAQVTALPTPGVDLADAWEVAGALISGFDALKVDPFTQRLRQFVGVLPTPAGPGAPLLRGLMQGARASASPRHLADLLARREALVAAVEACLSQWDVWVGPVFPRQAFPHTSLVQTDHLANPLKVTIDVDGQAMSQFLAYLACTLLFNVTGHPVVVMPIGYASDGLPLGVQVVGRRGAEAALLSVIAALHTVTPPFSPPPTRP